jgi:hypothetical protein
MSWHRIIIQGTEGAVFANPLKPTKQERKFVLYTVIIFLIAFAAIFAGILLSLALAAVKPFLVVVGVLVAITLFAYAAIKYLFILPATACGDPYKLKDAAKMMKGLFWKLSGAAFFVGFINLMIFLFGALALAAIPGIMYAVMGAGFVFYVIAAVFSVAFVALYIVFYFTAYGAGVIVISNYYMTARARYEERLLNPAE